MDARRELELERVLRCVELVPAGRVAAYGAIAAICGTGARQVAACMSRWAHDVPWWRKVKRIVPNVPIHVLEVGPDSTTRIGDLTRQMRRLKGMLTRAEVMAVSNRLTSLGQANLPIPKGIDPRRVRPGRPR